MNIVFLGALTLTESELKIYYLFKSKLAPLWSFSTILLQKTKSNINEPNLFRPLTFQAHFIANY